MVVVHEHFWHMGCVMGETCCSPLSWGPRGSEGELTVGVMQPNNCLHLQCSDPTQYPDGKVV